MVKTLPTMQETQVQSLGWEEPPEKGTATHSSILASRIPWTEESGGLFMGSQRVGRDHDWTDDEIKGSQAQELLSSVFWGLESATLVAQKVKNLPAMQET